MTNEGEKLRIASKIKKGTKRGSEEEKIDFPPRGQK